VAGCCEHSNEPLVSGAAEVVIQEIMTPDFVLGFTG
jgi:hypothetical protein